MPALTQEEIKDHLLEATTRKARMSRYADLLGFRKLSKSKSRACPPAYTGQVREFYEAIIATALELSGNYDSLSELQEQIRAQDNFTESLIDDKIEEYGSVIWNDGRSGFVTIIDDENDEDDDQAYPRHLIYNNENDRVSIRTFIYCLTLVRTCRNMMNQGGQSGDDPIIQTDLPYTAPRSFRVERSNVAVPDPDTVSVESTRTVPKISMFSNTSGSGSLQTTGGYQIPTAQMVPPVNNGGISSSLSMPQPNTVETSLGTSNNLNAMEGHCQSSEMSRSRSMHMPFSSLDRSSNRNYGRGEETRQHHPQRKRRRSIQGEGEDTPLEVFTGRSTRRKKGPTVNVSRSTSPSVASEVTDNSEDQRLRDIPSDRTTRNNVNEMSCVRCQSRINTCTNDNSGDDANAVTGVATLRIHIPTLYADISEHSSSATDSVVGSPMPSLAMGEQGRDDESTLIVKLKIQSQREIRQRQAYRKRLAAKLPSAFEMSSEQPKVLEDVVKLIQDIRALDSPLSRSSSSGRLAPYQLVLDQWLSLVNIYLRFRNNSNFNNDPSTWATYRNSLELAERMRKDQIINEAHADILDWSVEHDKYQTDEWSRCATSTLLEMADWMFGLDAEQVEEIRGRFMRFNKRLVEGQLGLLPL